MPQLRNSLGSVFRPQDHILFSELWTVPSDLVPRVSCLIASSLLIIQFSSVAQLCLTLCDPVNHSTPGLPVHHQLPESSQTHVHRVDDVIQPSHPLLSLVLLPSIFPSIRVFSNESALCIRWPKHWSFSFRISPSNEHPRLIPFRMDWLDFLAVQGTLKSLLQHYSSKASILWRSAFFTVQLSHPYMTTGKTIALTRWTFVGKVMSLLLNMLSRLVITFLPRSKRLLISWLQSPWGDIMADTLKPCSQKTSQSNHTRTTALSNSMKLSHARGATQEGRVMVERFDRMWSTG